MHTSRQLLGQIRRARRVALALSICINVLMLAVPLYVLNVLDLALPAASGELLMTLGGMVTAVLAGVLVLDHARGLVLLRAGLWLDHTLGQWVIETAPARCSGVEETGREMEAIAALRAGIAEGRLCPALDLPWAAAVSVVVFLLDPMLGLAAAGILAGLAMSIATGWLAANPATAASRRSAGRWLHAVARARVGALSSIEAQIQAPIQASGAARQWALRNAPNVSAAYTGGRRINLAESFARIIGIAGGAGLAGLGTHLAMTGRLGLGALAGSIVLIAIAFAPLVRLAGNIDKLIEARRGWRMLNALAEKEARGTAASEAVGPFAGIVLRDAAWTFPGSRTPALTGVSLAIAAGECIAITGPSGAGKSALAALVATAAAPFGVSYLPDTPVLLEGTVRDNIAGFDPERKAGADEAAERAGVYDIVAALPEGLETQAGADGSGLPMRARRAVGLARALGWGAQIVVLDEPELGLDEARLDRLAGVIGRLRSEGTSVVIATAQPRLCALADRTVVLDGGSIASILPGSGDIEGSDLARLSARRFRRVA